MPTARVYIDGALRREVNRKMRDEVAKLTAAELLKYVNSEAARQQMFERIAAELTQTAATGLGSRQ